MSSREKPRHFEQTLTVLFRKIGLKVKRTPSSVAVMPGILFEKNGHHYRAELKTSSEGRSDRLIPLLAQAILQARTYARASGRATPVAVVAAPRIPSSVVDQVQEFAREHAPDVGVGAIDGEGLCSFAGFGLEVLNAKPSQHPDLQLVRTSRPSDAFSDLNQWMLKVLIGQHLPADLINVPREQIQNASHLASMAEVSVTSAARLVKNLSERGFLKRTHDGLQLGRLEELFDSWMIANRNFFEDTPARWILKKGPNQIQLAVRSYVSPPSSTSAVKERPKCCLGLFGAAEALGHQFVHGAPAHIYLESITQSALHHLGLTLERSSQTADVYIRRPVHPRAIFQPTVVHNGAAVSDILQVWLDVCTHPSRGKEQAREIWRRVIQKFLLNRK